MAPQKIRSTIERFKSALKKAGFPAFKLVIYGSYARGEARKDSDIDVCIVSEKFSKNKEKYRKEAVFVAYQIDPRIQVVTATPKEIDKSELSPLFSQVKKDGLAA